MPTKTVDPLTAGYGPAPEAPISWVEWRAQGQARQGSKGGQRALFVPYLDSRHIAELLDTWVGPLNWRATYEQVTLAGKPALWGIVEVRHPERPDEWIAKRDVGVPSNFEAAKGLVSDAFKRAGCVAWGCGRNVYRMPSVLAPCKVVITKTRQGEKADVRPNDETLPFILAHLKDQGIDASGSRVADDPDEPEEETPAPVNGQATAAPSAPSAPAAAKAPASKATAKKAPASKRGPAKRPSTEGANDDDASELAAALAALPEPEAARTFITSRGVNPDTWAGLTEGKVRSIRSALKNMAKVQGSPGVVEELSSPPEEDGGEPEPDVAVHPAPAPPRPPAPPAPVEHSVRVELAERAEKLPDAWGQVLRQEIVSAGVTGLRGTTGEYVLGVPAGDDWDAWLESWMSSAESKLTEDGAALPPGGEPY